MKVVIFLISFLLFSALCGGVSSQRIAIMNIIADSSAKKYFSERELENATKYLYAKLAGKLDIINMTQLKEVYDELVEEGRLASRKQCVDEQCRIELGQEAAANYNLNAVITQFAGTCTLTVEMINLKTTMSEKGKGASQDFKCSIEGLKDAIVKVSQKLTGEAAVSGATSAVDMAPAFVSDSDGYTADTAPAPSVSVQTSPQNGMLIVNTTPRGLDIIVDGKRVGKAPLRLPVAEGKHTVEVVSRCFEHESDSVGVDAGDEEEVSFEPDVKTGDLKIVLLDQRGMEVDGVVFANGEEVGDIGDEIELPVCTDKVTLKGDEFGTKTVSVQVRENTLSVAKLRVTVPSYHASTPARTEKKTAPKPKTQQKEPKAPVLRTFQGFDIGYGNSDGFDGVAFGYHAEFSFCSFFGFDLHVTMLYAPVDPDYYFDMQYSAGPKFFIAIKRFVPFLSVGGSLVITTMPEALMDNSWHYGGGIFLKSGFDFAFNNRFAIGAVVEYLHDWEPELDRVVIMLRLNY